MIMGPAFVGSVLLCADMKGFLWGRLDSMQVESHVRECCAQQIKLVRGNLATIKADIMCSL